MTVQDRLFCLYLGDTKPTKYWSIWVAFFAAMGMLLRSQDNSSDMHLLIHLMPLWMWSVALLYVVAARTSLVLFGFGNQLTRLFTPLLSIFLWGFLFASQFVAPHFGLGLLFLVPALQETWILSRVFWDERLLWKQPM